jgi:N-acyl-D-aspartate/D-glutamate deacylase
MADLVIRGALIVDGTGDEPRTADVAVTDGRISAIGEVGEAGDREVDGTGLMLAPGFIDPHTHYDAQLHWDPTASPSNLHGVTTIVGGNCGFTLAPLQPGDGDYVARMMAKVEGMPLEALELGLDWGWESFGDFLDRLDGAMAINAGFLVGHSALRRYVVGADGQREATAEEIEAMAQLLRSSIEAGGMGFSTSLSFTHSDGDGVPVTSRFANRDEVLTLTAVVSEYEGTSLEFVMDGCLNGYTEEEEDYILEMARVGKRPLNWNVLTVDSRKPDEYLHQLEVGARAAEEGHAVVALTMPTLPGMTQSFGTHCGLWLLPGWKHIMGLPLDQKKEYLAQSGVRHLLAELAASETGALSRLTTFARFEIGDTFSEANEGLKGRVVEDIAAERGQDPFDTLVDIVSGRRLPDDPVAAAHRRRRRLLGAAPPGVGRRRRHAGRLGRRGPPRPHARLQLPDQVPGRHVARQAPGQRGTGGADDDPGTRPSVRADRPGHDRGGQPRRPGAVRPGHGRFGPDHDAFGPARRHRAALR